MNKEWTRLREKHVWDEASVEEWSSVAARARREGITVHFGRLFGICVQKNAELPDNDLRKKFKGRVVFQGNNVTNQNWENAFFQDLGSNPATMAACRFADV